MSKLKAMWKKLDDHLNGGADEAVGLLFMTVFVIVFLTTTVYYSEEYRKVNEKYLYISKSIPSSRMFEIDSKGYTCSEMPDLYKKVVFHDYSKR